MSLLVGLFVLGLAVVFHNHRNIVQSLYIVDVVQTTELKEERQQSQQGPPPPASRRYINITDNNRTQTVLSIKGSGYVAPNYYQHDLGKDVFIVSGNFTRPWKVNRRKYAYAMTVHSVQCRYTLYTVYSVYSCTLLIRFNSLSLLSKPVLELAIK